jgi:hypothetical protein
MIEDKIKEYYEKFNFPAVEKLFTLLKNDGVDIKRKEVNEFLMKQKEHEMLKINQVKKKKGGHITAFTYKQSAQMDIYDLSKFSKSNKNYKYMLVLIDVFTRKAFIRPLKNKNSDNIVKNLMNIFNEYIPHSITSDSDTAFLSQDVQKLFNKYDIIHDVVIARNDHRALGIIDRFALTVKTTLSKIFLINKKTNWIDHIQDVCSKYNDTPHSGIENISPNDATKQEYQADIGALNSFKAKKQSVESSFNIGDNVRIRIDTLFRKGSEPRYTDKIYNVTDVNGKRITLNDGKTYLESFLVKTILTDNDVNQPNVIQQVNKENSIQRKIKKSGVNTENIIDTKRTKVKNNKYVNFV